MLIKDYKNKSDLNIEEVKSFFGVPCSYPRQGKFTFIEGQSSFNTAVFGTAMITEKENNLYIYAITSLMSGAGSMIMRKICNFADLNGFVIEDLHPSPYNVHYNPNKVKNKNKKDLVKFYERFGFNWDKSNKRMYRNPMQVDRNP